MLLCSIIGSLSCEAFLETFFSSSSSSPSPLCVLDSALFDDAFLFHFDEFQSTQNTSK